jgi:hypothetical protein
LTRNQDHRSVVVTANRLGDGAMIYRGWRTRLGKAAVVTTAPAVTEFLAAAVADDVSAVGAYVAPVRLGAEDASSPPICARSSGRPVRPCAERQRSPPMSVSVMSAGWHIAAHQCTAIVKLFRTGWRRP